jgi:Na+/H+ antiporter NhaA
MIAGSTIMPIFSYYNRGLQLRNIMIEKIAEMSLQAADLNLQITKKYDCGIAELQLRTKCFLQEAEMRLRT